jgi:hypothetical protein
MQNLNINKYDSYNASIKLPGNDLDISDVRLTRLFDSLKIFENVYFIGNRAYFSDDQVDQTIDFLSEEVFIKNTSKSFRLFCRLKPFHICIFHSQIPHFFLLLYPVHKQLVSAIKTACRISKKS